MAALSSDLDFLELVRKSGLLSEDIIKKFEQKYPETLGDPSLISATMLKEGMITSFQSKVLLSGKHLGFILGPYKVMELIGKGGMGRIFLAEHMTLHRRVAIKALQSEKTRNPELLQRFYREARAAAALDHPNIVKIFDVSEGAGTHFLVMEFVSGRTLKQIITTKGPLPYQKAVRYIIKTATGLKHAHEKGFVHRDIKPDNIMVSTEGIVKILDMGLARSLNQEADNLTKMLNPNAVYGSADYISPEQSIGGTVDARSDLYSLGATLFALITGAPPFSGTAAQILVSHQLTKAPDLSGLIPSVPPQLSAIVAKLMAKKPEKRYRNAGELINALQPFTDSEQISTTPVMVKPNIEPKTIIVVDSHRKSPITKPQSKQQEAKKNRKKQAGFSVTPRTAMTVMITILGMGLTTLLVIFLINGSKESEINPIVRPVPTLQAQNSPVATRPDAAAVSNNMLEVNESKCLPLDMKLAANVISSRNLFYPDSRSQITDSLTLPAWGKTKYHSVPFELIDPLGTNVPNVLIFQGGDTPFTKSRPTSVTIPCNSNAKVIHILGGISGWAFPHNSQRTVALIARLKYKNGESEEHQMINGIHFADWRMPQANVPTAPIVLQVDRERHLRYISITPKKHDVISEIEFVKGENNQAAPIFFAITIEKP